MYVSPLVAIGDSQGQRSDSTEYTGREESAKNTRQLWSW